MTVDNTVKGLHPHTSSVRFTEQQSINESVNQSTSQPKDLLRKQNFSSILLSKILPFLRKITLIYYTQYPYGKVSIYSKNSFPRGGIFLKIYTPETTLLFENA